MATLAQLESWARLPAAAYFVRPFVLAVSELDHLTLQAVDEAEQAEIEAKMEPYEGEPEYVRPLLVERDGPGAPWRVAEGLQVSGGFFDVTQTAVSSSAILAAARATSQTHILALDRGEELRRFSARTLSA